jgi:hypothetical protein
MPSHKLLNGIVRSLAESFTSLMNYIENDYVMGHIIISAWHTGAKELRVNLLTGQTEDSPLLTQPVKLSIQRYIKIFPDLVKRSRSSMDFINSAYLVVTVDPTRKRRVLSAPDFMESPFTCTVSIVDDRGKLYSYTVKNWWYPETPAKLIHLTEQV